MMMISELTITSNGIMTSSVLHSVLTSGLKVWLLLEITGKGTENRAEIIIINFEA